MVRAVSPRGEDDSLATMASFTTYLTSVGDPSQLTQGAVYYVLLVFSLSFHEFAHAWSADRLGDDTARMMGRLTLNPIVHMHWLFTVALPLYFIFGGGGSSGVMLCAAKPVPFNPVNFRKPTRDAMLVSAAGPGMNVLLALFFTAAYWFHTRVRGIDTATYSSVMLIRAIQLNLGLAVFNMLPIPPLDGHRVAGYFMPAPIREAYYQIGMYGLVVLLLLMRTGFLARVQWAIFEKLDLVWRHLMPNGMPIFGYGF
jgi:Zn-dependent protease